jgi:hypothetical protein
VVVTPIQLEVSYSIPFGALEKQTLTRPFVGGFLFGASLVPGLMYPLMIGGCSLRILPAHWGGKTTRYVQVIAHNKSGDFIFTDEIIIN